MKIHWKKRKKMNLSTRKESDKERMKKKKLIKD
jgi:hypothetical protein